MKPCYKCIYNISHTCTRDIAVNCIHNNYSNFIIDYSSYHIALPDLNYNNQNTQTINKFNTILYEWDNHDNNLSYYFLHNSLPSCLRTFTQSQQITITTQLSPHLTFTHWIQTKTTNQCWRLQQNHKSTLTYKTMKSLKSYKHYHIGYTGPITHSLNHNIIEYHGTITKIFETTNLIYIIAKCDNKTHIFQFA